MAFKRLILVVAFVFLMDCWSQTPAKVEKSLWGIQTGLLGAWGHHEAGLSQSLVLRSEIGYDLGIHGSDQSMTSIYVLSLHLEPRWYYNLARRAAKNKRTDLNSGNFITLSATYNPDWLTISNSDKINVIRVLTLIPKWGIKRSIGQHFTYEAGIGIGGFILLEDYNPDSKVALDLHLRLGYTF